MDCTIRVAKTKALISFAVTAKLICVFVFAYAKIRFSHNEAQFICEMAMLSGCGCTLWPYMLLTGGFKDTQKC